MDTGNWDTVERFFAQLIEAPPGIRDQLAAQLAAGDYSLQRLLVSLVAADQRAHETDGSPLDLDGERRYRLLEPIATGGSAEVWRALDLAREKGDNNVAIKMLRRSVDDIRWRARFEHEARILASLQHPNIAQVFDSGIAEDGRPYIVMEYVRGRHITEYCDALKLSLRDRLRILAEVCTTVAFVHRAFVVHRDIKPSNVLITHEGVPKLVDFGISRLLDPDAPDATRLTQTGEYPMTLRYSSPEQRMAAPITTATDVYGLGLLVHELLAGCLPRFQAVDGELRICNPVDTAMTDATEFAPQGVIVTIGLLAANRRADETRFRRFFGGAVISVLGRALEVKPERRYQRAEDLAADLLALADRRSPSVRPAGLRAKAAAVVRSHPVLLFGLGMGWGVAVALSTAALHLAKELEVSRALPEIVARAEARADMERKRGDRLREAAEALYTAKGADAVYQTLNPGAEGHPLGMSIEAAYLLERARSSTWSGNFDAAAATLTEFQETFPGDQLPSRIERFSRLLELSLADLHTDQKLAAERWDQWAADFLSPEFFGSDAGQNFVKWVHAALGATRLEYRNQLMTVLTADPSGLPWTKSTAVDILANLAPPATWNGEAGLARGAVEWLRQNSMDADDALRQKAEDAIHTVEPSL